MDRQGHCLGRRRGRPDQCTITHEKPATSSMTVVGGDGTIYKTETEAQSTMKTTKVCTTN